MGQGEWELQWCGPEGWRRGGAPRAPKSRKSGGPKGGGPKFSRFFFPAPAAKFVLFFPLFGVLLVEFWWCSKRRGAQMCTFGLSGCRVNPAASGPGLHTEPEGPKQPHQHPTPNTQTPQQQHTQQQHIDNNTLTTTHNNTLTTHNIFFGDDGRRNLVVKNSHKSRQATKDLTHDKSGRWRHAATASETVGVSPSHPKAARRSSKDKANARAVAQELLTLALANWLTSGRPLQLPTRPVSRGPGTQRAQDTSGASSGELLLGLAPS